MLVLVLLFPYACACTYIYTILVLVRMLILKQYLYGCAGSRDFQLGLLLPFDPMGDDPKVRRRKMRTSISISVPIGFAYACVQAYV